MISVNDWHPADGLTLETNALRAAQEQARCLALTAGPGAGKTEMLAQRADFLLRTGCCRYPRRILAISFKVDASRNLKERVRRRCGASLSARFDSYTFHAFAKRLIERFRVVLTGIDAVDPGFTVGEARIGHSQLAYKDLVPLANQILSISAVARRAVRQTYSDVFLDEFQDCTDEQYMLIKNAFHGTDIRLTAVGDTKQKIMGWAGALEGIFSSFAADFNAVPLNMYRNFRSQAQLLRLQNEIIRVMDPTAVMPDEMIVGNDGVIEVQRYDTALDEAGSLAEQIRNWINVEEIPCSEIAILISRQPELYGAHLMAELTRLGVPFRNEQNLQDLSSEPAVRLIIDYLLVLFADREPDAYTRLMSQLNDSAFDEHEQASLRSDWLRFFKQERENALMSELIDGSFASRWAYVTRFLAFFGRERLMSLSNDYTSGTRLTEIIEQTRSRLNEMLSTEPEIAKALNLMTDNRAVHIMSIHKSKGLEFDSVIILGVENETFWGRVNDERCAFFVGVSRAKKRLVLTSTRSRPRPTGHTGRWTIARSDHEEFLGYADLVEV